MSLINRIRTDREVTAMVTLDTFDLITARVRNLLSWDRRISMTQRYTYTGQAPELTVGLTLNKDAPGGGIVESGNADSRHFGVYLRPGLLTGFGFAASAAAGHTFEAQVWERFHAHKAESPNFFERRRDMTRVRLVGGLEGDGPARDDLIVISDWNRDGVCSEMVISFDTEAYLAACAETT